jgi:hypothetical protein
MLDNRIRPSGKPSSTASRGLHPDDARTVKNSTPTPANLNCQSGAGLRFRKSFSSLEMPSSRAIDFPVIAVIAGETSINQNII